MIDLSGKVAAVTGAAGGIGAEVARTLAKAGARVVLGDVRVERGEHVAKQIRDAGGEARFIAHDTSNEAQWIAFIDSALDIFGGLDILVNNAGIEQACFLENVTVADIQALFAVNVTGVLIGHKHAVRAMKPNGRAGSGGSIINLSSVAGLIGTPGLGVYSASKGAVRLLTKAAAVEFGRLGYGIRVNSIHPGLVETEMGEKLLNDFVSLGMFKDRPCLHADEGRASIGHHRSAERYRQPGAVSGLRFVPLDVRRRTRRGRRDDRQLIRRSCVFLE